MERYLLVLSTCWSTWQLRLVWRKWFTLLDFSVDPVYLLCPHNLTIQPDFTLIFQPTSHTRRSSVFVCRYVYLAIFIRNHFLWCGKLCPKLFILFCLKHRNFLFSWLFLYNRPKVFKWKRKFFNVFRRSIMSVKGFYPLCFIIV